MVCCQKKSLLRNPGPVCTWGNRFRLFSWLAQAAQSKRRELGLQLQCPATSFLWLLCLVQLIAIAIYPSRPVWSPLDACLQFEARAAHIMMGLSATWDVRTGPVRRLSSTASPGVPKRAWAMVSFSWGAWHWQLVSSANGAGAVRV